MSELPPNSSSTQKPKLLDLVRAAIRTKHYSKRTEDSYVHWVKKFVLFHSPREIMIHQILFNHHLSATVTNACNPGIAISHGVNKKHPKELGEKEINEFLTHLAVNKKVSASTQNSPREILI